MKILAIDPGTKSGWAHSSGPSGVWNLSVKKDESSGMRLIRLRSKLNEIKESVGVDLLCYEMTWNAKFGHAIRVAGEICGTIQVWCIDNGVEFKGFSAGEIKRHATGKGNAKKEAMIAAAQAKFPHLEIIDDNHADALMILGLAKEFIGSETAKEAE